jgi:tRNA dimethylallyltransferase
VQEQDEQHRLFVGILSGPTASGKSSAAVEVAKRHNLAIISADSMQVYRGLEVGTGTHPEAERQGVPHHLLSIVDPTEDFYAARFTKAAMKAAQQELEENGRRSLLVGGTGMWLQALREGLFDGPGRDESIRVSLRTILDEHGPETLHQELKKVDPVMADRLSPNDHVRVLRALEVFQLTGKQLSVWYDEDQKRREALGPLLPLVVINFERPELIQRIDIRVDLMIATGWLEEARALYALNLPDHAPAQKALGYRELFEVIEGKTSLDEAVEKIKTLTRKYAKRQMTWFRGQRDVKWVEGPDVKAIEKELGLRL